MQRDFKIGMFVGLILAIAAAIWLSTRPSLSTRARMVRSQYGASLRETSGLSNDPSANTRTMDVDDLERRRTARGTDDNQPSRISNQLEPPDLTVYEQAEKIKTRRFHIVRQGENLSVISKQYYGSAGKWPKIVDANRSVVKDANKITPGTKLIIPD